MGRFKYYDTEKISILLPKVHKTKIITLINLYTVWKINIYRAIFIFSLSVTPWHYHTLFISSSLFICRDHLRWARADTPLLRIYIPKTILLGVPERLVRQASDNHRIPVTDVTSLRTDFLSNSSWEDDSRISILPEISSDFSGPTTSLIMKRRLLCHSGISVLFRGEAIFYTMFFLVVSRIWMCRVFRSSSPHQFPNYLADGCFQHFTLWLCGICLLRCIFWFRGLPVRLLVGFLLHYCGLVPFRVWLSVRSMTALRDYLHRRSNCFWITVLPVRPQCHSKS